MLITFVLIYFQFTDDEERLREELKDLIDDNPIEESDAESDASGKQHSYCLSSFPLLLKMYCWFE